MADDYRYQHLGFVTQAIERMARNSFVLKGWCVTLASAIIALGVEREDPSLLLCALLPISFFWASDAYYLAQERLFRALYDEVRTKEGRVDFAMTSGNLGLYEVGKAMRSGALVSLYGALISVVVAVGLVLACDKGAKSAALQNEGMNSSCQSAP